MTKTRELLKRIKELEAQAVVQMVEDYPINTTIEWMRGYRRRCGRVMGHNRYSTRLEVMSVTNTRVWIEVSGLVEAE